MEVAMELLIAYADMAGALNDRKYQLLPGLACLLLAADSPA
jgi:hypothetical protein